MDGIGVTYESHRGRPFDQFLEKLALVRSTARFGINYVVNETTLCDLSQAADFAFEQGAEELLLLPQVDANGDVALSGASRDWLSRWASDNWSRHRLATSTKGGEYIDAPMLMASEPEHEIFDFMHVDAFGMLKTSAFATTGTKLTNGRPIMPSVDELHVHRGVLQ